MKSWCDCAAISGLQFINLTFTTRFSIIISTIFTFDLLGQAISSRIPSRTRLPRLVLLHWSTISKQIPFKEPETERQEDLKCPSTSDTMRPSWSSPTSNCYYFFSSSFEPKSHRGSAADADRRARLHIASFSLCGGLSSKNSATSRARVFGLWSAVNAADVARRRRRHSHGTLKKQLLTQTVLAMSAVPSAQNVAAVFTRATPPCWRPPPLLRPPRRCWCLHHCKSGCSSKGQQQQGQSL